MAALSSAKRIVIKIGSALLVEPQSGVLRRDWLVSLASDVSRFKKMGVDVAVSYTHLTLPTKLEV